MNIRILGWRSKGMKCPDIDLKFDPKDMVDFIQMKNGTGKTTTLTLIKIALTGNQDLSLLQSTRAIANNNKKALIELLNKNNDIGYFSLDCSINTKLYTFEFVIDKDDKEVIKFSTQSPEYGGKGRSDYDPPEDAAPFLTPQFVELFVFDGEKAGTIFDSESGKAEATINTLCQFNILDESIEYAENFLKEKAQKIGKGDKGKLTGYNNEIKIYTKKLEKAKEELDQHRRNIKKYSGEKVEKEKRLDKLRITGSLDFKSEKAKLNEKISTNKSNMEKKRREIVKCILNPTILSSFTSEALLSLNGSLETLKLPDKVARAFFDELSNNDECICGTKIGKKEKEHILLNKENYLDDDLTGLLNSIKTSVSEERDIKNFNIKEHLDSLADLVVFASTLEVKLVRLNKNADKNIDEAIELTTRIKELTNMITDEEEFIKLYTDKPDRKDYNVDVNDDIYNIKVLQDIIEKITNKYHEYNKSITLKNSFDTFQKIIRKTKEKSSKIILSGMKSKVQEKIDIVLSEARPPIKIDHIGRYVKLDGQEGLSAGQRLSTAYCFMAAAFSYSDVTVPFIVDSPTGKIDDDIRENVGKMLPLVTDQFITFITPVERAYFYSHIRAACNKKCSHVTIYNRVKKIDDWYENFKTKYPEYIDKRNSINDKYGIIYGHKAMSTYTTAQEAQEIGED